MIQRFRWKFIGISVASLLIILLVTIGNLVALSFYRDNSEANRVLDTLSQNNGNLGPRVSREINGKQSGLIDGKFNPEMLYQYRYFTVVIDKNNNLLVTNRPNNFTIEKKSISEKTMKILEKRQNRGTVRFDSNNYIYQISKDDSGQTTIIFLNTSLIFAHSWTLLRLAIILGILALLLFATILGLLSKKAIRPMVTAYKKQQQFITNAGHELKTPIAIISANTEMEEMLGNESEWTKSTKEQTERLTNLINHLISLARISENVEMTVTDVNLSKLSATVSHSFSSVMLQKKLNFTTDIDPEIYVHAEKNSLRELLNIFLDNAQKYCDDNGKVNLSLHRNLLNNHAVLTISNTYAEGKNVNYKNFFDRFYREDESHNNKKSGFGIGLSMAQDLVHAYKGKIKVNYHEDTISFVISLKLSKKPVEENKN